MTSIWTRKKFNSFANQLDEAGYATADRRKVEYLLARAQRYGQGISASMNHCLWQMYDRDGVKRSRFYQPLFSHQWRKSKRIRSLTASVRTSSTDFMVDFIEAEEGRNLLGHLLPGFIGSYPLDPRPRWPEDDGVARFQSKRVVRNVSPKWSSIWTRTSAGS